MKEVLMLRGAHKLLTVCTATKPDERVLIVTDFERAAVGQAVAAAAHSLGAQVVMTVMPPLRIDSEEPPAAVAAAMLQADVIFSPVKRSIAHSRATHAALQRGARVLSMTDFVEESLISGGIEADFTGQRPECDAIAAEFTRAKALHLTTPAGTDLRLGIAGRKGNSHACIIDRPGQFSGAINIEANVAPVEGTAEGIIVADAAIPNFEMSALREPVVYTVRGGRIVSIDGGEDARRVRDIMAAPQDPGVYNIAQVAVGLNPSCRTMARLQEAHGYRGTCHIGIGTSANLGGEVRAAMHYDCIMWRPTLRLDDVLVVQDGQIVYGRSPARA